MPARYPAAVGLPVISAHTLALADLGDRLAPEAPVDTCGSWTMADLVWHLAEVQMFWTYAIANRPAGPEAYEEPTRPEDPSGLTRLLRDSCAELVTALETADPAGHAWSWAAEQTVAFTLRRQSHEALVHHLDGVMAAGDVLPDVPVQLAADGVDELVTVMLTEVPAGASYRRGSGAVRVYATDTADEWTMRFGQVQGTGPRTGDPYDLEMLELDPTAEPDATVAAPALPLLAWLWGRGGDETVEVTGSPETVRRLRAAVVEAT